MRSIHEPDKRVSVELHDISEAPSKLSEPMIARDDLSENLESKLTARKKNDEDNDEYMQDIMELEALGGFWIPY